MKLKQRTLQKAKKFSFANISDFLKIFDYNFQGSDPNQSY